VNALTGNDWQAEGRPTAELEQAAGPEPTRSDTLAALRDTLIVFSMQLSFRVTMFLRHLNY
jgi:hypothetical protein